MCLTRLLAPTGSGSDNALLMRPAPQISPPITSSDRISTTMLPAVNNQAGAF